MRFTALITHCEPCHTTYELIVANFPELLFLISVVLVFKKCLLTAEFQFKASFVNELTSDCKSNKAYPAMYKGKQ